MKVGFIGLGLMGNPMAKNILKNKFPLTVWNRTISKTKELQKLGAKVGESPSDIAKNSDVVITMVTGSKELEQVIFGKEGIVGGAKKGLVIIDMSTIGPRAAVKIFTRLGKREVEFLDAPVTGSTPKAITGELTIFIGGKQKVFEKVRPILNCMGTSLHFVGTSGQGQAVKLINNLLVAAAMEALAEGMLLADAQGLSRKKVAEVLENVPALSPFQKLKLPHVVKEIYPTLFSAANMSKDLGLALDELKNRSSLPTLARVSKMYGEAVKKGLGSKDISVILEVLK